MTFQKWFSSNFPTDTKLGEIIQPTETEKALMELAFNANAKLLSEDSGIPEYDEIARQYNNDEITLQSMADKMWNTGYKCGRNNE